MATSDEIPYGYGGPVVPEASSPTREPCGTYRLPHGPMWRYFLVVLVLVPLLFICGLWIIGLKAERPPRGKAIALEIERMDTFTESLRQVRDGDDYQTLAQEKADTAGKYLWEIALRRQLIDNVVPGTFTSFYSEIDLRPSSRSFEEGVAPQSSWCSYTSPRMDELASLLDGSVEGHFVLITLNATNWQNYPEMGVAVAWSDSSPGWLTYQQAHDEFGISEEDWAYPAHRLFGKKAPFQYTYE